MFRSLILVKRLTTIAFVFKYKRTCDNELHFFVVRYRIVTTVWTYGNIRSVNWNIRVFLAGRTVQYGYGRLNANVISLYSSPIRRGPFDGSPRLFYFYCFLSGTNARTRALPCRRIAAESEAFRVLIKCSVSTARKRVRPRGYVKTFTDPASLRTLFDVHVAKYGIADFDWYGLKRRGKNKLKPTIFTYSNDWRRSPIGFFRVVSSVTCVRSSHYDSGARNVAEKLRRRRSDNSAGFPFNQVWFYRSVQDDARCPESVW